VASEWMVTEVEMLAEALLPRDFSVPAGITVNQALQWMINFHVTTAGFSMQLVDPFGTPIGSPHHFAVVNPHLAKGPPDVGK
jgi:hypothetical protein